MNATPLGLDASDPLPCPGTLLGPGVSRSTPPIAREGRPSRASRSGAARGSSTASRSLLSAQAAGRSALFYRPRGERGLARGSPPSRFSTTQAWRRWFGDYVPRRFQRAGTRKGIERGGDAGHLRLATRCAVRGSPRDLAAYSAPVCHLTRQA